MIDPKTLAGDNPKLSARELQRRALALTERLGGGDYEGAVPSEYDYFLLILILEKLLDRIERVEMIMKLVGWPLAGEYPIA